MTIFPPAPNNANTYLPPSPVVPFNLLISNITNANPCVITVTITPPQINSYQVNQLILLTIPPAYGMQELADQTFPISAVNGNNLTIPVNSTTFQPYITPTGNVQEPASISSAGSRNLYNFTQVPYHALNGLVGN